MDFQNIRQALGLLHQSNDTVLYAQFTDWLQAIYEESKEKVLRAAPEEREQAVGAARAYKRLLEDISLPMKN